MSNRGDSIRGRVSDAYEKTPGYLIYDVTEAVGLELDEYDGQLQAAQSKFDADNLVDDELTKYCYQRKGIIRKASGYAKGTVTVTGTGKVEEGDLFETENGVQFAAVKTVDIVDSGDVPIIAVIPGNTGMVGAETINDMPVTIAGISACINAEPTYGGYDEETDEALRERFYEAIRNPSGNGNKASYKAWAKQVVGVGDAKVFPLAQGIGTVDVVIIDEDMTPADEILIAEVQNYIDPNSSGTGEGQAPIGAKCYVSSAAGKSINVALKPSIISSASQDVVKANIESAITSYLKSIAYKTNRVSLAQIGNVILDVPDVTDYESLTLNGNVGNVSVDDREVAILGEVAITWA